MSRKLQKETTCKQKPLIVIGVYTSIWENLKIWQYRILLFYRSRINRAKLSDCNWASRSERRTLCSVESGSKSNRTQYFG